MNQLICEQFFRFQFVITQNNKLYTWGASPQLIRLLNQSRKRARTAQKFEETKNSMTNECTDRPKEVPKSRITTNEESDTEANVNHESSGHDSNGTNCSKNIELSDQSDEVPKSMASKLTAINLQDRIKNFLRAEIKQPNEKNAVETDVASKINSEYYLDDEYTEHYLPQQVDTADVVGEMVQVV